MSARQAKKQDIKSTATTVDTTNIKAETAKVEAKEAVKAEAVKEPAAAKKTTEKKTTSKKAADKKTEAVEKTTKKKTAKKEAAAPQIVVQYDGSEATIDSVVEKITAEYVSEGHRASSIKNLKVYLKPEDGLAYYVINEKVEGSVNLF